MCACVCCFSVCLGELVCALCEAECRVVVVVNGVVVSGVQLVGLNFVLSRPIILVLKFLFPRNGRRRPQECRMVRDGEGRGIIQR